MRILAVWINADSMKSVKVIRFWSSDIWLLSDHWDVAAGLATTSSSSVVLSATAKSSTHKHTHAQTHIRMPHAHTHTRTLSDMEPKTQTVSLCFSFIHLKKTRWLKILCAWLLYSFAHLFSSWYFHNMYTNVYMNICLCGYVWLKLSFLINFKPSSFPL